MDRDAAAAADAVSDLERQLEEARQRLGDAEQECDKLKLLAEVERDGLEEANERIRALELQLRQAGVQPVAAPQALSISVSPSPAGGSVGLSPM